MDLTFTGSRPLVAKGTAGSCKNSATTFGFEADEAAYPGLGLSFSMAQLNGGTRADVKWVIDGKVAYGDSQVGTIVVSPDHASVTIDMDLAPFSGAGPEHVKGMISCPAG